MSTRPPGPGCDPAVFRDSDSFQHDLLVTAGFAVAVDASITDRRYHFYLLNHQDILFGQIRVSYQVPRFHGLQEESVGDVPESEDLVSETAGTTDVRRVAQKSVGIIHGLVDHNDDIDRCVLLEVELHETGYEPCARALLSAFGNSVTETSGGIRRDDALTGVHITTQI